MRQTCVLLLYMPMHWMLESYTGGLMAGDSRANAAFMIVLPWDHQETCIDDLCLGKAGHLSLVRQ